MFKNMSEFLKGYVKIRVTGCFCEKFLNLVIKNHIVIKQIKRISDDEIILTIYVKDFKKIKSAAKISCCKVKIVKKKGLGFTAFMYRKRIILISGIALCFVLVYTMSNMIFSVDVKGNYQLSTEYIKNILKENGIKPFVFKTGRASDVAKRIMSENENIAWIGIDISGSKVIVDVVEKPDLPQVYDSVNKFNIISTCDGVITEIYIKKGFSVTSEGDTVRKGQLLVSGVTDSATQQIRYVNPEADIKIISWITEVSKESLTKNIDNFTNRKKTNIYLEINNKTYGILRKIPYTYFSVKTTEFKLPFGAKIVKKVNMENVPQKIVYNEKELFEIERKKLYNKIISTLSDDYKVLNVDAEYTVESNNLVTTVTCTVEGPFYEKSAINE